CSRPPDQDRRGSQLRVGDNLDPVAAGASSGLWRVEGCPCPSLADEVALALEQGKGLSGRCSSAFLPGRAEDLGEREPSQGGVVEEPDVGSNLDRLAGGGPRRGGGAPRFEDRRPRALPRPPVGA